MKSAMGPEHFKVDRTGGLPANAEYFVLDIVNDFECRVALARLSRQYEDRGQKVHAEECKRALWDSMAAHAAAIEARNPKAKSPKGGRKVNARP